MINERRPIATAAFVVGILAAAALNLLPPTATAVTVDTSLLAISATVSATCRFSTTNMAFQTYVGPQLDATGTVTVTCTNTTYYSVGINRGTNSSGNHGWRLAGPGGSLLPYQVFKDAERSTYWSPGPGSDAGGGTGNGAAQVIKAYGRILPNQRVTPGPYTDTLTVTFFY